MKAPELKEINPLLGLLEGMKSWTSQLNMPLKFLLEKS
jgi:hypothetical protein